MERSKRVEAQEAKKAHYEGRFLVSDLGISWPRYATITDLSERSRNGLGITVLMKLCYFLQAVRKVDLGYDFRLGASGPFDAQVLDDIYYTEFLGGVRQEIVPTHPYSFIFRPGQDANLVKRKALGFLSENEAHLAWVMDEFGSSSAAKLELLSTMVCVDREAVERGQRLTLPELVRLVRQVQPRWDGEYVFKQAELLAEKSLLEASCER